MEVILTDHDYRAIAGVLSAACGDDWATRTEHTEEYSAGLYTLFIKVVHTLDLEERRGNDDRFCCREDHEGGLFLSKESYDISEVLVFDRWGNDEDQWGNPICITFDYDLLEDLLNGRRSQGTTSNSRMHGSRITTERPMSTINN